MFTVCVVQSYTVNVLSPASSPFLILQQFLVYMDLRSDKAVVASCRYLRCILGKCYIGMTKHAFIVKDLVSNSYIETENKTKYANKGRKWPFVFIRFFLIQELSRFGWKCLEATTGLEVLVVVVKVFETCRLQADVILASNNWLNYI